MFFRLCRTPIHSNTWKKCNVSGTKSRQGRTSFGSATLAKQSRRFLRSRRYSSAALLNRWRWLWCDALLCVRWVLRRHTGVLNARTHTHTHTRTHTRTHAHAHTHTHTHTHTERERERETCAPTYTHTHTHTHTHKTRTHTHKTHTHTHTHQHNTHTHTHSTDTTDTTNTHATQIQHTQQTHTTQTTHTHTHNAHIHHTHTHTHTHTRHTRHTRHRWHAHDTHTHDTHDTDDTHTTHIHTTHIHKHKTHTHAKHTQTTHTHTHHTHIHNTHATHNRHTTHIHTSTHTQTQWLYSKGVYVCVECISRKSACFRRHAWRNFPNVFRNFIHSGWGCSNIYLENAAFNIIKINESRWVVNGEIDLLHCEDVVTFHIQTQENGDELRVESKINIASALKSELTHHRRTEAWDSWFDVMWYDDSRDVMIVIIMMIVVMWWLRCDVSQYARDGFFRVSKITTTIFPIEY